MSSSTVTGIASGSNQELFIMAIKGDAHI